MPEPPPLPSAADGADAAARSRVGGFLLGALREIGLVLAVSLSTLCFTYPAFDAIRIPPLHGWHVQDVFFDVNVIHWDLWWMNRAVAERGTNPFHCDELFHPAGVDLFYTPYAPLMGFASIPLQQSVDPAVAPAYATNVLTVASFGLAAYLMTIFLRVLGLGALAALVGGLVFAFAPFRLMHLPRLHYLAGFWLPVYALVLLRHLRVGGWRWAAAAGLAGVATLLTDHQHFLFLAFLAPAIVVGRWWRDKAERSSTLKRALVAGLVQVLVLVPLLLTVGRPHDNVALSSRLHFEETETGRPAGDHLLSAPDVANLAYLVAPSIYEMFAGPPPDTGSLGGNTMPYRSLWQKLHVQTPTGGWSAAMAALLLACFAWGVARGRVRLKWVWIALALFGFVMALGPTRLFGETPVGMPYRWVAAVVPPMQASRYPAAFVVLGLFAAAPLVAAGYQSIARCCSLGRIASIAMLAVGVGTLWTAIAPDTRLAFSPPRPHPAYDLLANADVAGHVVELPLGDEVLQRHAMTGQMRHHRKMAEGAITRVGDEARAFLDGDPFMRMLAEPTDAPRTFDAAARDAMLRGFFAQGFRFVLVHRAYYRFRTPGALDATLARLHALRPTKSGRLGDVELFEFAPPASR